MKIQFDHSSWYYKAARTAFITSGFYEPTYHVLERAISFDGFACEESAKQAAETIAAELKKANFTEDSFSVKSDLTI